MQCNSDIYKNSFFPKTIIDWNHLEEDLVPAETVDSFRKAVFAKSFFSSRTAVWQTASFCWSKPNFCRTVLYGFIVILEIFAGHLSDRIKYFVSQNENLLDLTDRPALFVKTGKAVHHWD